MGRQLPHGRVCPYTKFAEARMWHDELYLQQLCATGGLVNSHAMLCATGLLSDALSISKRRRASREVHASAGLHSNSCNATCRSTHVCNAAVSAPEVQRNHNAYEHPGHEAYAVVPLSQITSYALPGDVILFSCVNAPSTLQRLVTRCSYDHVGIVVDAAWQNRIIPAPQSSVSCTSPTDSRVADPASASLPNAHVSVSRTGNDAASSSMRRSSTAALRFFGLPTSNAGTDNLAPHFTTVAQFSIANPIAALRSTGRAALPPDKQGIAAVVATRSLLSPSVISPVQSGTRAQSQVSLPHCYDLQLLEATGEGVRVYPLVARLRAYGNGYTHRIALRRLLLGGEEGMTATAASHSCGRLDCRRLVRPGAIRLPSLSAIGSLPVWPSSPDVRADCVCTAIETARREFERRIGLFAAEATGRRYSLGAKLLRFPFHMRTPNSNASITTFEHSRSTTCACSSCGANSSGATGTTNPLGYVCAAASYGPPETSQHLRVGGHADVCMPMQPHKSFAMLASRDVGDALASAVPVQQAYYCSELLAAAYQRAGLLPSFLDARGFWPSAWVETGAVDRYLASSGAGARLDREVLIDSRSLSVVRATLKVEPRTPAQQRPACDSDSNGEVRGRW